MLFRKQDSDTICAISTAAGIGGISVIRVSGRQAAAITRDLCQFLPHEPTSHRVYYGILESKNNREGLDEVLVTFFAEGRSFTGEEVCEISCHGGRFLSQKIVNELIACGARHAEKGEFTYRAFMNGRIDLVQAEGVLALIESQGERASKLAFRQLKGDLSGKLAAIEDRIIWILAHLEANIDFAAEDIEFLAPKTLVEACEKVINELEALLNSYKTGRRIKEGVHVALVGQPNVGKSSLLNRLVGEDRAIVTNIPGTTRDLVEGRKWIGGFEVIYIDTAGLRDSTDSIERIGIERTHRVVSEADLVVLVVEAQRAIGPEELDFVRKLPRENTLLVRNKADLVANSRERSAEIEDLGMEIFDVSAETGQGIGEFEAAIEGWLCQGLVESEGVLTQSRHFELLSQAFERMRVAKSLMAGNESPDVIAFELQESLKFVMEVLGKQFDDQVLDRVFQEFCLGK